MRYEITVQLPNGDWVWSRDTFNDFHEVLIYALSYADALVGRVHHMERIDTITTVVD